MSLRFSLLFVAAIGWIPSETGAAPASSGTPQPGALLSGHSSSSLQLPLQLVASGEDPAELDEMGAAMEVAGDYLFIAAPGDGAGRVDVWYRGPTGYFFAQRLTLPPQLVGLDSRFGRALAADGSVLVVGTKSSNDSGRAVVYRRHGISLYSFEKILEPSTGQLTHGLFGEHVAVLEDELIAVSAKGELAVHVFEADLNGNFPSTSTRVLNQVNTGTTPSMSWATSFGATVGLHRTGTGLVSILVGMEDACFYQRTQLQAPDEVTPDPTGATAARTGGVAVLRKSGGAWQLQQRLIPDWSKMKDFGFEVNADGPYVAVGAIYSRIFSNGQDAGSASVYRWNGWQFALVKTVPSAVPLQNGWFGYSVELRDDHLLVGQPHLWGGPQGLVEVFTITANDVLPVALLVAAGGNGAASPSTLGDCFGREIVTNSYGEVIIAAPFSAPGTGTPSSRYGGGAVYIYR